MVAAVVPLPSRMRVGKAVPPACLSSASGRATAISCVAASGPLALLGSGDDGWSGSSDRCPQTSYRTGAVQGPLTTAPRYRVVKAKHRPALPSISDEEGSPVWTSSPGLAVCRAFSPSGSVPAAGFPAASLRRIRALRRQIVNVTAVMDESSAFPAPAIRWRTAAPLSDRLQHHGGVLEPGSACAQYLAGTIAVEQRRLELECRLRTGGTSAGMVATLLSRS